MARQRKDWSKIEELVRKIKEQGWSYKEGAEEFGVKLGEIYEYNKLVKKKGNGRFNIQSEGADSCLSMKKSSDKEEKTVADKNGQSLPEEVEEIILKYRREHPDHGYKRIEDHLKSHYFIVVSRKKIRELLKSHGLEKTNDSSFDKVSTSGPEKGTRRFEAAYPRDLYQMDVTYVYITGIPVLYLVMIIDDYSRFCVASELMRDQKGTTMIEVLHRAVERYGKPRRLLTDQGSSFYTWSFEKTQFQTYLDEMKIEHIVTDPHSPETVGKVERLHQTVQKELLHKVRFGSFIEAQRAIEEYIHSYNYNRRHQGINGACPSDRFHGVIEESARIESELSSKLIDFSKGYLIFKNVNHTLSVVCSSNELQVYLDGNLIRGG